MDTFCSCGRRLEDCGGPGTGHAAVGSTGMPVIVLTDIPAPVDRDQRDFDRRPCGCVDG